MIVHCRARNVALASCGSECAMLPRSPPSLRQLAAVAADMGQNIPVGDAVEGEKGSAQSGPLHCPPFLSGAADLQWPSVGRVGHLCQ